MPHTTRAINGQTNAEVDKLVYSHWDSWNPREYLKTYFRKLGQDSFENLKFLVRELKKFEGSPKKKILDFGAGPTIFAGIAAIPYASSIHMCDYLEQNLFEINKWLKSEHDAFDWSTCVKHILDLEEVPNHQEAILERSMHLKKKTTAVFRSDASLDWPIFSLDREKYPIVISNYCADSATSSKEVWGAYMNNVFNLLEEDGTILIAALRKCRFYRSGNQLFPSADLDEHDLKDILLKNEFDERSLLIEVKAVPECSYDGFSTVMFASGKKLSDKRAEVKKIFADVSLQALQRKNKIHTK